MLRHTFLLSDGTHATHTACLPDGLYFPFACGLEFPSEASWTVNGVHGSASSACGASAELPVGDPATAVAVGDFVTCEVRFICY